MLPWPPLECSLGLELYRAHAPPCRTASHLCPGWVLFNHGGSAGEGLPLPRGSPPQPGQATGREELQEPAACQVSLLPFP